MVCKVKYFLLAYEGSTDEHSAVGLTVFTLILKAIMLLVRLQIQPRYLACESLTEALMPSNLFAQ